MPATPRIGRQHVEHAVEAARGRLGEDPVPVLRRVDREDARSLLAGGQPHADVATHLGRGRRVVHRHLLREAARRDHHRLDLASLSLEFRRQRRRLLRHRHDGLDGEQQCDDQGPHQYNSLEENQASPGTYSTDGSPLTGFFRASAEGSRCASSRRLAARRATGLLAFGGRGPPAGFFLRRPRPGRLRGRTGPVVWCCPVIVVPRHVDHAAVGVHVRDDVVGDRFDFDLARSHPEPPRRRSLASRRRTGCRQTRTGRPSPTAPAPSAGAARRRPPHRLPRRRRPASGTAGPRRRGPRPGGRDRDGRAPHAGRSAGRPPGR